MEQIFEMFRFLLESQSYEAENAGTANSNQLSRYSNKDFVNIT